MVAIKENSEEKFKSIDSSLLGWPDDEHSWFLEGDYAVIWPWYESLTEKTEEQPAGIIPAGKE